jgi:DnaJ domain
MFVLSIVGSQKCHRCDRDLTPISDKFDSLLVLTMPSFGTIWQANHSKWAVTQDRTHANPGSNPRKWVSSMQLGKSYYDLLELHPSASAMEIRRAYWELSKRYHPDTTELPLSVATPKFQQLNEAYATLSNPARRSDYDDLLRTTLWVAMQASNPSERSPRSPHSHRSSAYLDPIERPLSAGEVFALFIMGATLLGCLLLAIAIAVWRGDPL